MFLTTLCYIEHDDHVLLLHRNRKSGDINQGKWIGVGGKFMDRESPEECLLREVREETGYSLTSWRFRGLITFLQEDYETEFMCLYTADDFLVPVEETYDDTEDGTMGKLFPRVPVDLHPDFGGRSPEEWPVPECDEGELAWIKKEKILDLPMWEGDRIFLSILDEREGFFSLRLEYSGDKLIKASLDGSELQI